jgi:protein-S-isoprenylcysteine O-methyltransferase Ste14
MNKILSFIFGIFVFSFLPITGWGLNDASGFFSNPFRLSYIAMMALLSLLVVIFVPEEGRSRGRGKDPVKRHVISLLLMQVLSLSAVIALPWFDHKGIVVMNESSMIRIAGLLLAFFGFLLMNWSVIVLEKQFSTDITIQENHKLITRGPYRFVRHPRYLGIILFFSGISLVFRSWIGLVTVLLMLFVHLWRIADEEKLMRQEFGEEWEKYKQKTKVIFPFIL